MNTVLVRSGSHHTFGSEQPVANATYVRGFFLGTPLVWQSMHFTVWTLWGLLTDMNVVSMVSTLRPQLESCGWHVAHDARVF